DEVIELRRLAAELLRCLEVGLAALGGVHEADQAAERGLERESEGFLVAPCELQGHVAAEVLPDVLECRLIARALHHDPRHDEAPAQRQALAVPPDLLSWRDDARERVLAGLGRVDIARE